MQLYVDVAEQYQDFASYARGESACFEDWARRVAEDPEVLAWLAGLPAVKQQPNLVFAAVRWHGVPAPGPYDAVRSALLADTGAIRETIATRSTQTNEVGRLATLTPALALIEEEVGAAVALIEVGASAGLCLYPDRFRYDWRTEAGVVRIGPPEAPLLSCEVEGPAPLPPEVPAVAWRGGIDLNPLDAGDDDAMAWLGNLVWPEQQERRERLRAAVSVARREPTALVHGDLLSGLQALVEEASQHGPVVVFHSAVVAYLDEADRQRFHEMMTRLVGQGACRWVSNEAPQVLPAVTATGPEAPAHSRPFVLGLDGRAVGWTHGHGRWLRWH